jgi:hypothetical protein
MSLSGFGRFVAAHVAGRGSEDGRPFQGPMARVMRLLYHTTWVFKLLAQHLLERTQNQKNLRQAGSMSVEIAIAENARNVGCRGTFERLVSAQWDIREIQNDDIR